MWKIQINKWTVYALLMTLRNMLAPIYMHTTNIEVCHRNSQPSCMLDIPLSEHLNI